MSRWIAVAAALTTLGSGACGTNKPAVCDSFAAAQNSIQHIRNTSVAENGLSQLTTELSQLKPSLEQLYADAKTQFAAEIESLRAAVYQFSANLTMARTTPDVENLAGARTALVALQDSAHRLADAVSGTC
jgi:Mg2+ and Co2+ transporter CorA